MNQTDLDLNIAIARGMAAVLRAAAGAAPTRADALLIAQDLDQAADLAVASRTASGSSGMIDWFGEAAA